MSRKQQAAASRSELVEAARHCFTELGYDRTTVAAILKRAGMARGALYHYFPGGKAEIFAAVFESVNEAFHQRRDALLSIPSPVARLRAGVAVFLEMCIEDALCPDRPDRRAEGCPRAGRSGQLLCALAGAGRRSGERRRIATPRRRCHGCRPVWGRAQCR